MSAHIRLHFCAGVQPQNPGLQMITVKPSRIPCPEYLHWNAKMCGTGIISIRLSLRQVTSYFTQFQRLFDAERHDDGCTRITSLATPFWNVRCHCRAALAMQEYLFLA